MINKMVMESAKKKKRNISTAWIDYKKAFDSVPHDWIVESLTMHKFDPTITNFIKSTMNNWKTSLLLTHLNGQISTEEFSTTQEYFKVIVRLVFSSYCVYYHFHGY